jgi:hypothetical protein
MTERQFPDRDPHLMIDLTRDQLSLQLQSVDAIDAKLGLFLGVGSALIAVLMGVLTVQTQALGIWAIRGTAVTVGIYLVLATACIFGLWLRPWRGPINAASVYHDHYTVENREIGWELVNTYVSHHKKNQTGLKQKVSALRLSSIGLASQTLALVATLALVLIRA